MTKNNITAKRRPRTTKQMMRSSFTVLMGVKKIESSRAQSSRAFGDIARVIYSLSDAAVMEEIQNDFSGIDIFRSYVLGESPLGYTKSGLRVLIGDIESNLNSKLSNAGLREVELPRGTPLNDLTMTVSALIRNVASLALAGQT